MSTTETDDVRWRGVLDRIAAQIDERDELLSSGRMNEMRAPSMDVPEDLGPVPDALVPTVHELLERLAAQQAEIERELMAVGRELARCATVRPGAISRSVDAMPSNGFEARA